MKCDFFEEIQQKRNKVKEYAKTAFENEWISIDVYNDVVQKVDQDVLTIGVIGQMKCGKSTFINAFLFKDQVLPAATTPMTAALTIITYGEQKAIDAEFYTKDEWNEIELMASRDLGDIEDDTLKLKIKSAKELVAKSADVINELASLLGTVKRDNFESLKDYVSADGLYVAITKSVTIYYPELWLKGIQLVDTPGFNDPVVSREERTKDFLNKADVVLMLLYAGRAFDAIDKDIVFEQVRRVGIGKVLIGINKYDINYLQGETIETMKTNVSQEILKVCRSEEYRDSPIREVLRDLEPIPFSAHMALLAKLPLHTIKNDPNLLEHWHKICDNFDISTQAEMNDKSLIRDLENAVRNIVEKSKFDILFKKSVDMISQAGLNKLSGIEEKLNQTNILLDSFSMSDDDLDKRIEGLSKVEKKLSRNIKYMLIDLEEKYDEELVIIRKSLENVVSQALKELRSIIDNFPKKKIKIKLEDKIGDLAYKDIPGLVENSENNLKKQFKSNVYSFNCEIEELLDKYMPDVEDMLKEFKYAIKGGLKSIKREEEVEEEVENDEISWTEIALDIVTGFIKGATGIFYIEAIADYINIKSDYHDEISDLNKLINSEVIPSIMKEFEKLKPKYIQLFKDETNKKIIEDLISKLHESKGQQEEKEAKLRILKEEMQILQADKAIISDQIAEMRRRKNLIL